MGVKEKVKIGRY